MDKNNFLAVIFDWLGEALERFSPSAFRFLAAFLPYLTPIPVAWLTAHSSAEFLNFTPTVAFIFVFVLEGIGLWFTSLLVDAVVDWTRSRNGKSFVPVALFGLAVSAYIYILVNLNVTLEQSVGTPNPNLSRVITLLCFLPLLTGIGNGYYKLKVEYKFQQESDRDRKERIEREIRQERSQERLEKLRIKTSNFPIYEKVTGKLPEGVESFQQVSTNWRKVSPQLSDELVTFIADHEPRDIVPELAKYEIYISPRTASNWKKYAPETLRKRGLR